MAVNIRADFEYRDGHLYRTYSNRNIYKGQQFGCITPDGYIEGYYGGRKTSEHRLVWQYFNGPIPQGMEIDHINGDRSDNRIENLRLADNFENGYNRKININSQTGIKGVGIDRQKHGTYYKARYKVNGKRIGKTFPYTGEGLKLATEWVQAQRLLAHKEFVNHG